VNRWIITVVSLLALLAGVWLLTRESEVTKPAPTPFVPSSGVGAPELPEGDERATAPGQPTVPTAAKRADLEVPAQLPRPEAPRQDLERQAQVQIQLAAALEGHRKLAEVRSLSCNLDKVCDVELVVTDLEDFMPVFARMGEPGGGLTDDNTMMVLQAAEPVRGSTGATIRFQLVGKKN